MPKHEIIEFKPLSVSHYIPSEIKGNYTTIEDIKAVSQGGQDMKLRRFVRPDEYRVKVGQVYEGRLKPRPKEHPDYSDTINEVKALSDWGGIEEIGNDCWDTTDPEQEALKRQASMEAWGHIHSACSLLGGMSLEGGDDIIIGKIIGVAELCEIAHKRFTEKLYKELKATSDKTNGGKE